MRKLSIAVGILSTALIFSCKKDLKENSLSGDDLTSETAARTGIIGFASDSAEHVPNQLLIRFKKGTSATGRSNVLTQITGRVQEHVVTKMMQRSGDNDGFYVVNTPLQALEAISKAKGREEVEYAQLNYIYTHVATSNDPYFTGGSLWGMYSTSTTPANTFGSQAAAAWANGKTGSETVYIGVIDEGAMYSHEDLNGNFGNQKEIWGNNSDDDGNGLVDDTYGWDFVNNDKTTFDGNGDDHGSHVAGTIGAKGGNGKGVAGVVWDVKMISGKFLGPRGGTTANAIKAVDYFTNLKNMYLADNTKGLNIVATNNSWGGGGYSKDLENAITRAGDAGVLFICAAGNDGRNIDKTGSHSFPACYYNWNLIAVAAISSNGSLASYSNYGQVGLNKGPDGKDETHSFVDIGAPGSGIYSTVPGKGGRSAYSSYNGTSMATPHVTGAAALFKSINAGATAQQIKDAIMNAGKNTSTNSLSGKCITGGRINVSGF